MKDSRSGNHGTLRWRVFVWRVAFLALIVASLGGCVLANNEPVVFSTLLYGGLPVGPTDEVLVNTGYVVGYSDTKEDPLWVGYHVFAVSNPVSDKRPSRFRTDTRTAAQVSHDDYTNSGYDRGHMAPNATIDYCYGQGAQLETFYMSNVCPQTPTLNRGIWAKLEATVRDWANAFTEVWVFTGPIFDDDVDTLASGMEIPDAFYKIVVDEDDIVPYVRVLSFIIPQEVPAGADLASYLTSVDEVEQETGFDFLSKIPRFAGYASLEEAMESEIPTQLWTTEPPGEPHDGSNSVEQGATFLCNELQPRDVVIYRLLVNAPGRAEIPNEYFTLLNTTSTTVDLRGLTICDEQACWTIPSNMTDAVVEAGGTWTVYGRIYNPTSYTRGIALRNSGETVKLKCGSIVLDSWSYPRQSLDGVPITRPGY